MRSSTGQALLSEQSKACISVCLAGGPFTNRNEHPEVTNNNDTTENQMTL